MSLVASALLNPACTRLIDFAIEEYGLVSNLKNEIRNLKSTANLIRGVLHDADKKQAADEAVREWLRRLKRVLFDAEDILDEVATDAALRRRRHPDDDDDGADTEGAGGKVRNIIDSHFCCMGKVYRDHNIAHRVKEIGKKLRDMNDKKQELGLILGVPKESFRHSRPPTTSLLSDSSYIMGRDEQKEEIIQHMLRAENNERESNHCFQVLSIVGMGGVGKTTLAKLILDDSRVKEHFQLRIWVCVSEDFDLNRITQEVMAASLTPDDRKELSDIPNWDLHQRRFRDKIRDKRFLLVLDDVWEEDHSKWETLCEPLIHGANGSKIIVTTRKQTTSKMVKGTPFPLKVMSDEDMWKILRGYAFDNSEPSGRMQLEIVGKQIVSKLKGLPLAARIIGRLLNENLAMQHWTEVLNSHTLSRQQNSDDGILPILKLSYDHLSVHLKQCFAYCSLFPKDDSLVKRELVSMWMAQNFIQSTTDRPHESVDDLFNKSLLEQSTEERASNYWLDNKLYGMNIRPKELVSELLLMHDLVHDMAESVSEDDCFRLGDDAQRKEMNESVRHVSVATTNFDISKLMKIWEHENLRTLVFLRPNGFELKLHNLNDLFSRLKRLRVLGLRGCRIFEGVPPSIGELKHLRFLDLSNTLIRHLPESVCRLHNLQVLKLRGCRLLSTLPRNTSALVNLRHLELDSEIASDVPGLRKLTALQELIVTGSKVGALADMNMLRELRVWNLEGVTRREEANHARLQAKEHLEVLTLRWSYNREQQQSEGEEVADAMRPVNRIRRLFVTGYPGVRSPKWMVDPSWVSTSFLERVELVDCKKWEVLPPLGQLPCLKFLEIGSMAGVRRIGPEFVNYCEDGRGGGRSLECFPSLEVLDVYNMPELEEWEWAVNVDEGDGGVGEQRQPPHQHVSFLPQLRALDIQSCEKLRELPPLPPTLTNLTLRNVGVSELPCWMRRSGGDGNSNADAAAPSTSPSSPSSPSLSYLRISRCPNITSFDSGFLQHPLPALEYLFIQNCEEIATLPHALFRHLPSLEGLYITDCPKLSWQPSTAEQETALPPSLKRMSVHGCAASIGERLLLLGNLQRLTSLSSLKVEVSSSETVARLGTLTSLNDLGIYKGAGGHVDNTALSKCLDGLSSLKSLSIHNCSAITTLHASLRGLTGLEIENCGELRSLGGFCPAFVSLEYLRIKGCSKLLHLIEEEAPSSPAVASAPSPPPRKNFSMVPTKITVKFLEVESSSAEQIASWLRQIASLEGLRFSRCPLLKGFGDDNGELENALLEQAPSLRRLEFHACDNLTSLPSGLRSLSSLETLQVGDCPEIRRLPSAGPPHSLKELNMYGCSEELKERCRKEGDPDCVFLSRIPVVVTDW